MSALQLILGTKKKSRKQWDVTQTQARRRQRKQQKQHKIKSRTRTKTKRFGRKASLLFNLWIGAIVLYLLVVYRMFFSGESNSNSNSNPPQHTIENYLSRVRANGNGNGQNNVKQEEVPQKERDDFRIKDLPRHCTAPFEFKEIIIKGERHSGTNWITSILEKNVKEGITVNQQSLDIGWKHGFLPPEGWGKPIEENEFLIVVTRDIFTWLPKMYIESYDEDMNNKSHRMTFSKFIRTGYTARCFPLPAPTKKRHGKQSDYQVKFCSSIPKSQYEWMMYNPNKAIAETAPNLIQERTRKYKQWLTEEPSDQTFEGSKDRYLQQRMHISLEHVIADGQQNVIGDELSKRCMPVYEDFRDVIEKTKWEHSTPKHPGKQFNVAKETEWLLSRYTQEDIDFILSQLDLDFEKKLGYNYDYIRDYVKHRRPIPEQGRHRHHHTMRHHKKHHETHQFFLTKK